MLIESDNSTLSVIIRFHDLNRLALLDEAIFSLALQFWRDVEIVVVLQNGSSDTEAQVAGLIEKQPWLGSPRYQIMSLHFPPGFDGRSNLLNHGIKHAKGRYLAFLDDDDYVYQHGYSDLIESLKNTNAVLAAGKCRISRNRKSNGHWYIYEKNFQFEWGKNRADLFLSNFIPIHSYVIDRSRINAEELWFDDQLPPLEDYDFLLRLGAKYEFDFSNLNNPVCEYRYHETNSLMHNEHGEAALTPKLIRANELIEARKDSLTVTLHAREFIQIRKELEAARFDLAESARELEVIRPEFQKALQELENAAQNLQTIRPVLVDLLTKQNRLLNKVMDKIYDFAHRRKWVISVLVFCSRQARKLLAKFRQSGEAKDLQA